MLGDAGVGKTCVLRRFAEGSFVSSTRATIGMDLKRTTIDLDGKGGVPYALQLWDTAGQEKFRSVVSSYYRGAHGVLLMYDVTRRPTFEALEGWLTEVRAKCDEGVVVVVVGNKLDLRKGGSSAKAKAKEVGHEEAAGWAKSRGLVHFETSAKTDEAVRRRSLRLGGRV